jgi:hypothetical protein
VNFLMEDVRGGSSSGSSSANNQLAEVSAWLGSPAAPVHQSVMGQSSANGGTTVLLYLQLHFSTLFAHRAHTCLHTSPAQLQHQLT